MTNYVLSRPHGKLFVSLAIVELLAVIGAGAGVQPVLMLIIAALAGSALIAALLRIEQRICDVPRHVVSAVAAAALGLPYLAASLTLV